MSNSSATSARVVVSDTEIEYSPARLDAKLTPFATARATISSLLSATTVFDLLRKQ